MEIPCINKVIVSYRIVSLRCKLQEKLLRVTWPLHRGGVSSNEAFN